MRLRTSGSFCISILMVSLIIGLSASMLFAQSQYVWGDGSAIPASGPGMNGYWKYCISVGWDVSAYPDGARDLSHATIILGLEECLDDCGSLCFVFPDTVGISDGAHGCTVPYRAEFNLVGDPTVPWEAAAVPTLKFEPYAGDCEPGVTGMLSVCFFSRIPPEAVDSPGGSVWIKFGRNVEQGVIYGVMPSCRGTIATDESTWSSIKRLFD
jgi:hypothetical protein